MSDRDRDAEAAQGEREELEFAQELAKTRTDDRPIVAIALIVACVIGAIVAIDMKGQGEWASAANLLAVGGIRAREVFAGEYWRVLTAIFLHAGFLHLLLNMWILWSVGSIAERLFGHVGFAVVYVGSGIFGGVASTMFNAEEVVSVGASGAIFGICAAVGAFLLRFQDALPPHAVKRLGGEVGALLAYNIFYGFTHTGIDNAAHIGGALGGFCLGFALATSLNEQLPGLADPRRWIAAVACLGVSFGTLQSVDPHSPTRVLRQTLHDFDREYERLDQFERKQDMISWVRPEVRLPTIEKTLLPRWQAELDVLEASPSASDISGAPRRTAAIAYAKAKVAALRQEAEEERAPPNTPRHGYDRTVRLQALYDKYESAPW